MSSASAAASTARAPRRINARLTRWWIAVNAAGATLLAAGTLEFYARARASGYLAPSQLWASLAGWLALTITLGATQPVACAWYFSRVNIAQRTLRGTLESFFGLLSGFLFPLLGMAMFRMPDAVLAAWIFVPTGIVFGWLISSSQSASYPSQSAAKIATRPPQASATPAKRLWRPKIRWKLALWWMAVNVAGFAFALSLVNLSGGAPAYVYLFLVVSALGVLHAFAGSLLISFVRMRNKAVRIVLGVTVGIVTTIPVFMLGAIYLWVYAAIVFWVCGPSGIFFGCLCASPQPLTSSPTR